MSDKVKSIKRGETIFEEGSQVTSIYLIQSGRVDLVLKRAGKSVSVYQVGAASVLGDEALLGNGKYTFSAVATADPADKANLLSSSISVAMNTTAFGLITAIPLILFHSSLQTKTMNIVDSLEMVGRKLLNSLSYKQLPESNSDRG